MDEPSITDLHTREEAEEEIDFEKGEVALRSLPGLLCLGRAQQVAARLPVLLQVRETSLLAHKRKGVLVALKKLATAAMNMHRVL